MPIPKLLFAIALAAFAAGCASSPPVRYFRLTAASEPGPVTTEDANVRAIVVGPFQLAEYLDRPQIVTLDGANAVNIADFERWAEPLDANFQSVVTANVSRLLGSDRVLEFPAQTLIKDARRVSGRVSRLDVDGGGLAVLEVQWGALGGDGTVYLPARRSHYEARAAGKTYAAGVAALTDVVTQFSVDVAGALK